jgi:hypothetical protein
LPLSADVALGRGAAVAPPEAPDVGFDALGDGLGVLVGSALAGTPDARSAATTTPTRPATARPIDPCTPTPVLALEHGSPPKPREAQRSLARTFFAVP